MKHNKKLTYLAQTLRKRMTKEEKELWYGFLRKHPMQFKRQVTCGGYILDFYCAAANLAIELDGSQHFENPDYDLQRDAYLRSQGLEVLHIPNNVIKENFLGVCQRIWEILLPHIEEVVQ